MERGWQGSSLGTEGCLAEQVMLFYGTRLKGSVLMCVDPLSIYTLQYLEAGVFVRNTRK